MGTAFKARLRRARNLSAALALLIGVVGCKKKAGDPCTSGQLACADPSTGLFCSNGKLTPMTCSGPRACTPASSGGGVDCDNSVANEGDGCNQADDVACSADGKAALQCKAAKFTLAATCKGPRSCQLKDNKIFCDNNLADFGDPCNEEGDYACSADKKLLMRCKGNKFAIVNTCHGPRGCTIQEHPDQNKVGFSCDDSLAEVTDACDEEKEESCSLDHRALQQCRNGRFQFVRACRGPNGCSYDERSDKFTCDTRPVR